MTLRQRITVKSSTPPTIEFDNSVAAWYIRFSKGKVAKTISGDKPGVTFAIDLDSNGEVVGVEIIGIKEFTISMIQRVARVDAPRVDFTRARFIPTQQSRFSEKELTEA